jgi:hypothetical protein
MTKTIQKMKAVVHPDGTFIIVMEDSYSARSGVTCAFKKPWHKLYNEGYRCVDVEVKKCQKKQYPRPT